MGPAICYSERAVSQIRAYLHGIEDNFVAIAAAEEIRRELGKLAADPSIGTAPPGPFEQRPIYRFTLNCGDTKRVAQVSYRVSADKTQLVILLFSSVPV